ncbi:hypothetical protein KC799_24885 [candidate division KSB1 bacterium]|nr:hypothetical protein [candidate division KSB1 bacterium]
MDFSKSIFQPSVDGHGLMPEMLYHENRISFYNSNGQVNNYIPFTGNTKFINSKNKKYVGLISTIGPLNKHNRQQAKLTLISENIAKINIRFETYSPWYYDKFYLSDSGSFVHLDIAQNQLEFYGSEGSQYATFSDVNVPSGGIVGSMWAEEKQLFLFACDNYFNQSTDFFIFDKRGKLLSKINYPGFTHATIGTTGDDAYFFLTGINSENNNFQVYIISAESGSIISQYDGVLLENSFLFKGKHFLIMKNQFIGNVLTVYNIDDLINVIDVKLNEKIYETYFFNNEIYVLAKTGFTSSVPSIVVIDTSGKINEKIQSQFFKRRSWKFHAYDNDLFLVSKKSILKIDMEN